MEREPVSVLHGRRWRHVARIDDRWTFDLWWLPEPVTRTCYRIYPGDGVPVTVFRDEWSGRWYRPERLTASEDERRPRWISWDPDPAADPGCVCSYRQMTRMTTLSTWRLRT